MLVKCWSKRHKDLKCSNDGCPEQWSHIPSKYLQTLSYAPSRFSDYAMTRHWQSSLWKTFVNKFFCLLSAVFQIHRHLIFFVHRTLRCCYFLKFLRCFKATKKCVSVIKKLFRKSIFSRDLKIQFEIWFYNSIFHLSMKFNPKFLNSCDLFCIINAFVRCWALFISHRFQTNLIK